MPRITRRQGTGARRPRTIRPESVSARCLTDRDRATIRRRRAGRCRRGYSQRFRRKTGALSNGRRSPRISTSTRSTTGKPYWSRNPSIHCCTGRSTAICCRCSTAARRMTSQRLSTAFTALPMSARRWQGWRPGAMRFPATTRWTGDGRPTGRPSAPRRAGPSNAWRRRRWRSTAMTAISPGGSKPWVLRRTRKVRRSRPSSAPTISTRVAIRSTGATSPPACPGCRSGRRDCSRC